MRFERSIPAASERFRFREYLDQRIAGGEVKPIPENALRARREMQESLQSIRRGIADADAGRNRTAERRLDELQAWLVRRCLFEVVFTDQSSFHVLQIQD